MEKSFGIIGYPVAHSISPRLFHAAYGGRYRYELIETESFEDAWNSFAEGGYTAVNVTAPFKEKALRRAEMLSNGNPDLIAPEAALTGAANILTKTPLGIKAHNSDYLGLVSLLGRISGNWKTAAVIGMGGAGKAAAAATGALGLDTATYHHDEIAGGVSADLIVYTCPRACDGIGRLRCKTLLEANYKNPCLTGVKGYIPGTAWHLEQALQGYCLMCGEEPDKEAMKKIYVSI